MKKNTITAVSYLKSLIEQHSGLKTLSSLEHRLKLKPLNIEEFKILFSSLWAFYRETPSGILSLSLRINDFWSQYVSPWEAMEKSSFLLSTCVDEFGLENIREGFLQTHHSLFTQAAEFYQVTKKDLVEKQNILPSGIKMGEISKVYYRKKSIPEALGFHLASELTSYPEFQCLYNGFYEHRATYNINSNLDFGLKFFWVHTLIEPFHLNTSELILNDYIKKRPKSVSEIMNGAMTYMKYYENLFNHLCYTLG